jgi:cytochrome c oxidase assembly factor CtaG
VGRYVIPVGDVTTAWYVVRFAMGLLSTVLVWMVCVLLVADVRPRGEVIFCSIGLPVVIAAFILLMVWARKEARDGRAQADEEDAGWPKHR